LFDIKEETVKFDLRLGNVGEGWSMLIDASEIRKFGI
jgi:hypothetical protein